VRCQFCDAVYEFGTRELEGLVEKNL